MAGSNVPVRARQLQIGKLLSGHGPVRSEATHAEPGNQGGDGVLRRGRRRGWLPLARLAASARTSNQGELKAR